MIYCREREGGRDRPVETYCTESVCAKVAAETQVQVNGMIIVVACNKKKKKKKSTVRDIRHYFLFISKFALLFFDFYFLTAVCK